MAVTKVTRIPEGSSAGWNRLWQRSYTVRLRVECDNRNDGPVTIRTAAIGSYTGLTLPSIGNSYFLSATERDTGSFAETINYELESAGPNPEHAVWIVTVNYGPYDASLFPQNPVDWPIKVTFGGQRFQRVVWADRNGNPIVNSAGDRFAEPVMADDTRSQITVVRNELVAAFDWSLAELYRDKTNLTLWNTYAANTVKVGAITTTDPQYNSNAGVWYYAVTYPFEVNRDTWNSQPLDQGYQYLDGSSPPKRVRILDKNGQEVSEAQLLDGSGHVLASTGTPVFKDFEVYDQVDFAVFNLNFANALGR